jgi:WD40 repeat protein/tRNA A-37 threonylcarbamoyl transferase component Bud32
MNEFDRMAAAQQFLLRYATDQDSDSTNDVAFYQRMFPGFEAVIENEFAALQENAAPIEPDTALAIERLGPYQILRELGAGGQGVVYLAEDTRLTRQVALKLYSALAFNAARMRDRLNREARLASQSTDPGVCTVHEAGEIDGIAYLAMEYVEGESLADKIKRERCSDRPDSSAERQRVAGVTKMIREVARAVHTGHERGVVHRDIKPSNIMLRPDGQPIVLDYGLARNTESHDELSMTGDLAGTPMYLAPERIAGRGDPTDPRADVYALGVTLYEGLTLAPPFVAPTRAALFNGILRDPVPPVSSRNPAVTHDLDLVVSAAMERDPERRYASAEEFGKDLDRVLRREPIHARPIPWTLRTVRFVQRHRVLTAVLISVVLGLVVSLYLLQRGSRALADARVQALIAESNAVADEDGTLALLLARKAFEIAPNVATVSRLTESLAFANERARRTQLGPLLTTCVGPHGHHVVGFAQGSRGMVWPSADPYAEVYVRMDADVRAVASLAFSPDGKSFVALGDGPIAKRFDTRGRTLARLQLPEGTPTFRLRSDYYRRQQVCISHDWIALGTESKNVYLFSSDGQRLGQLSHREDVGHVRWVAVAPNGKLCTGSSNGYLTVWDPEDWSPSYYPRHESSPIVSLYCGQEGDVLTASRDGLVCCGTPGGEVSKFHAGTTFLREAVRSADGTRIVTASHDRVVALWTASGDMIARFGNHSIYKTARFSPNGRLLVIRESKRVSLYAAKTGRRIDSWIAGEASTTAAEFTSDHELLTTGSDATRRYWQLRLPGFRCWRPGGSVRSVRVSQDGDRLLVGAESVHSYRIGDPTAEPRIYSSGRARADWVDGGRAIVAVGENGEVRVFDAATGTLRGKAGQLPMPCELRDVNPSGTAILCRTLVGSYVLSLSMEQLAHVHGYRQEGGCFINDKEVLITGGKLTYTGGVPKPPLPLPRNTGIAIRAAIDQQSGTTAIGTGDGHAILLRGRAFLKTWSAHGGATLAIEFSPDGRSLATGSADGTSRLWDVATGELQLALHCRQRAVESVAFTKDGEYLITGGEDGTVRSWPIRRHRLLALLRARQLRDFTPHEARRYGHLGVVSLYTDAWKAWGDEDWPASATAFRRVLDRCPWDWSSMHQWAFAVMRVGSDLQPALSAFEALHRAGYHPGRSAFYAACVCTRLARIDEALDWLEKAVVDGFEDQDSLQTNDLAALRSEPRFSEILASLRK